MANILILGGGFGGVVATESLAHLHKGLWDNEPAIVSRDGFGVGPNEFTINTG